MSIEYKGYQLHVPTSGGKAGKGCNVTGSVQVRNADGRYIFKQFRFQLAPQAPAQGYVAAMSKAKAYCDELLKRKADSKLV